MHASGALRSCKQFPTKPSGRAPQPSSVFVVWQRWDEPAVMCCLSNTTQKGGCNMVGKDTRTVDTSMLAVALALHCLDQDVVIVGCACAGLMGVGPDSLPVEVDPLSTLSQGRAAAAARRKAGRSALPTKGVSVLLGRLPPGCVARGFAQEVRCGKGSNTPLGLRHALHPVEEPRLMVALCQCWRRPQLQPPAAGSLFQLLGRALMP